MLKSLSLGLASAAAMVMTTPAIASTIHATAYLGGGSSFTWSFTSSGQGNVGFACFVDEGLFGMPRTTQLDRYQIVRQGNRYSMVPLSAVNIYPQGNRYVGESVAPIPVVELWSYLPEEGNWVSPDGDVDPLGRACVDGGIAGGTQWIEREYSIQIQ